MLNPTKNPLLSYSLKSQQTHLLLAPTPTPIHTYTFLQSNLQLLPSHLTPILPVLSQNFHNSTLTTITKYLEMIEKKKEKLVEVQMGEIRAGVIWDDDVRALGGIFGDVRGKLGEEVGRGLGAPGGNVHWVSYLASVFNILEMPLWSQIIMASSSSYRSMTITDRNMLIQSIKNYVNKYCSSGQFKFKPNKFILRQTHIQDITDFNFFLNFTKQPQIFSSSSPFSSSSQSSTPSQSPDFSTKFSLFKNRIQIIRKISKSMNINYYDLRNEYQEVMADLGENLEFMEIQELLFVYSFYVKIGIDCEKFMADLETVVMNRLEVQGDKGEFYLEGVCKSILDTWKVRGRYHQQLWERIVQPTLNQLLEKLMKAHPTSIKRQIYEYWNTIAYSIICSGLTHTGLPQKILTIISRPQLQSNKTYKIATQYLKLQSLKSRSQNLSYFLPAYLKQSQSHPNSPLSLSPMSPISSKTQSIEYNPIEHFWQNMIKGVLPSTSIHRSKYISVYEVDILVEYKGKYFAVEVQGSHYSFGKNSSGKKKIREEMLRCYGVTTIVINCADQTPKLIMRLKLVKDGERYVAELLERSYMETVKRDKEMMKNKENTDKSA